MIDDAKSSTKNVPVGTPHDSSIGDLLLILFINDFAVVSNSTECLMFADDTSIFCFGENLEQLYRTMNEQLKSYYGWFDANELSSNISKANYTIIHKPRQVVYDNELFINDRPLQRVTNTRFLGVTVQKYLCWKLHCNYISNKISKYKHLLLKIRNCVNVDFF